MPHEDYEVLYADRVARTTHLVEADHFAANALWERYAMKANDTGEQKYRVPWNFLNPGRTIQVGELDNMPVFITMFWAEIDGGLVCFWTSESTVVDLRLVQAFLNSTLPEIHSTDAMNFSSVLCELRSVRERARGVVKTAPLLRWACLKSTYPRKLSCSIL